MRYFIFLVAIVVSAFSAQSSEYQCPEVWVLNYSVDTATEQGECNPVIGQQKRMGILGDFFPVEPTQIPDLSCMEGHEILLLRVPRNEIEVLTKDSEGNLTIISQYQTCDSGFFEAGSYCGMAICRPPTAGADKK